MTDRPLALAFDFTDLFYRPFGILSWRLNSAGLFWEQVSRRTDITLYVISPKDSQVSAASTILKNSKMEVRSAPNDSLLYDWLAYSRAILVRSEASASEAYKLTQEFSSEPECS